VASRDWWIEKIKLTNPEIRYWTHFTKYQIAQFKTLAELDYKVLGERVRTEGAPDSGLAVVYPPKLEEKSSWLAWDYKTYKDFKLWTWLQATKGLDLPIGEETETWYNYFSFQSNQIKAKELLDPFRNKKQKEFDTLLQDEYNLVFPTASRISSVCYTIPSGGAHAQVYQDRSLREAQNSEMLIQCLKASITRMVYNKIYQQREKYIILRKNTREQVEDGVCFLKTIIDNYHSNTRSSTNQIRKQLATLNHYMRNVAKGDVSKLCEHTRGLMFELNAADETTNDLLANLI